tara:strand:+ start:712 stop:1287 length:576 start_codon:yes stop_codon:yes gene_type:complete
MKGYYKIRNEILSILKAKLPPNLFYHGIHHTFNALKVSKYYIKHENIEREDAKLLRLALLLHDIGFIVSNKEHEKESIKIAAKMMMDYSFSKEHINIIIGMILSTKIPQEPKTKLERIICDIDLDYLGSKEYYNISDLLFKEINAISHSISNKEWNTMQIQFLRNHKYHTNYAKKFRKQNKENRLEELNSL